MNVNDRYIPMTESDRIGGMKLMLDLGASVNRVSRGLQIPRDKVKKAAVIGASPTATSLADSRSHSLDQLAVVAEYERLGDTDAVEQLTAVRPSDFRFRAARIERHRHATRARLEASLLYAALGFGVLTNEPGESEGGPVFLAAEQLRTETGEPVSEKRIRADAARWAVWVEVEENAGLVDRDTGELVDPDTVDWDTRDDASLAPRDGLRHADTVTRRDRWTPTYYLPADQLSDSGLQIPRHDTGTSKPAADQDETPAARAERILKEAAAAAGEREVARLERRRVRELNERSLAAADRREEFLTQLLRRQRPPTKAAAFVAESLIRDPDLLKSAGAIQKARQLLGSSWLTDELAETAAAAPGPRAQVITLGLVLGACESTVDKSFWRYPRGGMRRYLRFLADAAIEIAKPGEEADYTLVDVEQAAAGLIDYHHIDLDD
ncbi:hypothetical protein [Nocardia wallacei]|uniref:hypothetical protein n=1 Tax=Nocardia wallacei TaxID=480035 RepID=UPI0024568792|nr:hypothetical protein [Nocardia wallacei]